MLPTIDGNDCPGDVACAVTDQERGESPDVVDINQMMLRRGGRRGKTGGPVSAGLGTSKGVAGMASSECILDKTGEPARRPSSHYRSEF
jgi:hypothetical protein